MRFKILLLGIFFAPSLFARDPSSVLVFPVNMRAAQFEDFEGLALALTLQSWQKNPSPLISFTAFRSKLIEYGMAPTYQPSLATKIRLAKDLCASLLVVAECDNQNLNVGLYDLDKGSWRNLKHPLDSLEGLARWLAEILEIEAPLADQSGIEASRIWASSYYTNDYEVTRRILLKLLQRGSSNHGLCLEYLDLFGDPLLDAANLYDCVSWRDIFDRCELHAQALHASGLVLDARVNPNDYVVHGRILLDLDRGAEACDYLRKADAYGLVQGRLREALEACSPQEQMR